MKNKTQQIKKKISEYVEGLHFNKETGMVLREFDAGSLEADITLEDILIALNEKGFRIESDENHYITITPNDKTSEYWGKYIKYKLNQPLENQSEETLNFLFEILC